MTILQFPSLLFTAGRAPGPLLAVVLHEYCSGIEALDSQMDACPRPKPTCPPGCHSSFHYGIAGCAIHQYVAAANTAWGFGVQTPTCPEPPCPPSECESCTGLTVNQYNPDLDGNLPVLPAFVADACGTANSNVLHVAVTGGCVTGVDGCCRFLSDPAAYDCFVRSLCEIFAANPTVVPSQNTLLVHCGELPCLDIDQLVLDILECLDAPGPVLPPCDCEPAVEDTATLALVVTDGVITGDVQISATTIANELSSTADGLFVPGWRVVSPILNGGSITPGATDVYVYSGVGAAAITLNDPISAVDFNQVIIKNRSASILTVNGDIEGGTSITLQGTGVYPFGNAGGEAVTLIFDFANDEWLVV